MQAVIRVSCGIEPTISLFDLAKTVHSFDSTVTVIKEVMLLQTTKQRCKPPSHQKLKNYLDELAITLISLTLNYLRGFITFHLLGFNALANNLLCNENVSLNTNMLINVQCQ
jgi:hypothetical protein